MTRYRLEFYKRNSRTPYREETASLPDRARPTVVDSKEAFDYRIARSGAAKVKIRYESNGGLAGETYRAPDNTWRIRWFKT